jgi:hypothetical protein
VQIPSPDAVPPMATIAFPAELDGVVSVSFDEIVHQVTTDNVYVWTPTTGSYPEIELACLTRRGVATDCMTGNVRHVTVDPVEALVLGERYEAVVNPAVVPIAVVDRAGNPAASVVQPFAAPSEVEQDGAGVSYGWRTVPNAHAFGGSFSFERRAGASMSFGFEGNSILWHTATGPAQGKAAVRIDGRHVGTFDQYSGRTTFRVSRRFTGLGGGEHTITVRVLGRASSSATDTRVVVDGFEVGGDRVGETAGVASWASDGQVAASDLAGASVVLTFRGSGIEWSTVRGPDQGRAAIWVDDVLVREVDNFAIERLVGVTRSITGLADGVHTLRIDVLGEARGRASGRLVSVDRFAVVL